MPLSLIAAVSENGVIGNKGALPWHFTEDMKRFKELTVGHVVMMGRKTWESLPEKFKPLPGRTNVVITRQQEYNVPAGVERYGSIDDALTVHPNDTVFVIGGAELYRHTIDRADTLYITEVHREVEGDAFFPAIDPSKWRETKREDRGEYSFVTYKMRL